MEIIVNLNSQEVAKTILDLEPQCYSILEDNKLNRFIYTHQKYSDFEESRYKQYQAIIKSEETLVTTFSKFGALRELCEKLFYSKEEGLRYLNQFGFDVDLGINHLHKLHNYLKKLKLLGLKEIRKTETINFILASGFIECYGRDNYHRPIVGIYLNAYVDKIEKASYIQAVIHYLNCIIQEGLFPGKVEQIVLLINFDALDNFHVLKTYTELARLIQLIYPSRFSSLYINLEKESSMIINELIFEHNRDKIVSYNPSEENYPDIDNKILSQFFGKKIFSKPDTLQCSVDNSFNTSIENIISVNRGNTASADFRQSSTTIIKKDTDFSVSHTKRNNLMVDSVSFEVRRIDKFTKNLEIQPTVDLIYYGKKSRKAVIKMEKSERVFCCSDDICSIF